MSLGVELKMEGLEQLLAALGAPMPEIKVGILNSKPRSDSKLTNAEVGAFHEFGTSKTPVRSFLRIPLMEHWGKRLEELGAVSPEVLAGILQAGTLKPWADKAAAVGEEIVAEAFASGGFGKWQPSNMKRKKVMQTLVETNQLRNSISSEVTL